MNQPNSESADNKTNVGLDFNGVIESENNLIKSLRNDRDMKHIGLAFSGGGIRSATFNLGILQGLATHKLLKEVDYLSTVSGGGYIGSWLTAWIHRLAVQSNSNSEEALSNIQDKLDSHDEPDEIKFLREYSNYLTPKAGLLSSDTLAAIANLVRNLVLTQSTLIAFLLALLLLPWMVYFLTAEIVDIYPKAAWLSIIAGVFLLIHCIKQINTKINQKDTSQVQILISILAPAYLSSMAFALGMIKVPSEWLAGQMHSLIPAVAGALVFALAWAKAENTENAVDRFIPAGTGAFGGWLFFWIAAALAQFPEALRPMAALGLGTALVMAAFCLMGTVLIGLAGSQFSESGREWWGRLGGWALMFGLAWALLFAVVVLGPVGLIYAGFWIGASGGLAWAASTAWGVWMGRSAQTGDETSKTWTDLALKFLPYIFVVGLLVLLAWLVQWGIAGLAECADPIPDAACKQFPSILAEQMRRVSTSGVALNMAIVLALSVLSFWWLNKKLDVNLFSMHHFYHNRLARCYLGASNQKGRKPSSFTGFDESDDQIYLEDCQQRPLHIVNTAMNLVAGGNLAWQQRKAASFAFTPLQAGPGPDGNAVDIRKYLKGEAMVTQPNGSAQKDMKGAKLSTAFAISGAAASPNMGYHSSAAMAFLLTLFNVRLGRWCPNPGAQEFDGSKLSPDNGAYYLLKELFALTDKDSKFMYLSDGGHFENLGIYELVRRNCKYIIACDAGQDEQVGFEDLGNAVRKCYEDFGARIDIDARALRPAQGERFSRQHCVMGKIHYKDDPELGYLFYIKASLTGDEPIDVLQYAVANPAFPHQSTADQWFDEPQFESYRHLGRHIAEVFAKAAKVSISGGTLDMDEFFGRLDDQWYAPSTSEPGAFSKHGNTLMELFETLRKNPFLNCLDGRFYLPSVKAALPDNPDELRQVHYVANRMIQLMEDVYLDLNLEDTKQLEHPDHKGWVELFNCWTKSKAFRKVWIDSKKTYGQRFQVFCAEHFRLP